MQQHYQDPKKWWSLKKIYPAVLGSIEKVAACFEKRCKQNYWKLFRKCNISPYLVPLSLKNRLCSSCSISRSTPQGKKWGLALMCSYFLRVLPATLVACVAGCLPACLPCQTAQAVPAAQAQVEVTSVRECVGDGWRERGCVRERKGVQKVRVCVRERERLVQRNNGNGRASTQPKFLPVSELQQQQQQHHHQQQQLPPSTTTPPPTTSSR